MGTNYLVIKYLHSYNLKYVKKDISMVVSSVFDFFLQLNDVYLCL